jgi:hypothetical protein
MPELAAHLEEVDPVDAREALEIGEREDQRLVDQPVDDQPVVLRIDLRDAAMMALEAEPVRRDDAVELVQRREAHRRLARRGEPRHVAADDVLLVFRRLAVGPHAGPVAERTRPFGDVRRQVFRIAGNAGAPLTAQPRPASGAAREARRFRLVRHGASIARDMRMFYKRRSGETISQEIDAAKIKLSAAGLAANLTMCAADGHGLASARHTSTSSQTGGPSALVHTLAQPATV